MSWQDRLIEAAITTPDGERYIFEYTDLEIERSKKTATYIFSDTGSALVQDFGLGEINIPLTIFFSGPDYDLTATLFEISASEAGISILEHPAYGIKNVAITSIKRQDSVRSAGGQAIFTLGITETIVETVPVSDEETRQTILAIMEEMAVANDAAFAAGHDTNFITDAVAAGNRIKAFAKNLKSAFNEVLSAVREVQDTFNNIEDFINSNIDFLLGAPLLLSAAVQRLINTPARIASSINSRVNAYLQAYAGQTKAIQGSNTTDVKNQRLEKQLLTSSIISSIAESNLFADSDGTGFLTRSDALENALALSQLLSDNQELLDIEESASVSDSLEKRFSANDTVAQNIKIIVSSTSKDLNRLSFSLKQEKIIITQKPRDIITLCFELYGTTSDEKLDFLIQTNTLTGSELIEIPKDREIKYYV